MDSGVKTLGQRFQTLGSKLKASFPEETRRIYPASFEEVGVGVDQLRGMLNQRERLAAVPRDRENELLTKMRD